jgi:hypothetical protein
MLDNMFDEIFEKIESRIKRNSSNSDKLAEIYVSLNDAIGIMQAFKSTILDHIDENLRELGTRWGECAVANYGITDPNPRLKVDNSAWEDACENSEELAELEAEYQKARSPFMVDATQDERPYIRKKRGV